MGCPFHCSGDRATSTLPTSGKANGKDSSTSRHKIGEKSKLYSLSEEHHDENEPEEEHLSLKTLSTAVRLLTSPPAHLLWISLKEVLVSKDPSLWVAVKHHSKIKQDPPEDISSVQDFVSQDDNEILEEIFIEAVDFIARRYAVVKAQSATNGIPTGSFHIQLVCRIGKNSGKFSSNVLKRFPHIYVTAQHLFAHLYDYRSFRGNKRSEVRPQSIHNLTTDESLLDSVETNPCINTYVLVLS
ncbi:uncharacterized protein CDAR_406431 [Caerostris darwini]|uniref:Uncharacterized protein n=1 Tax=Caerostris darwini TaxID=1538125 RepID=A0AAV4MM91_9ARAC|nr:uncharacterized protein CDAR_406431 [Caerostris darwini]